METKTVTSLLFERIGVNGTEGIINDVSNGGNYSKEIVRYDKQLILIFRAIDRAMFGSVKKN